MARGRHATAFGLPASTRTVLGPAVSLLGSGAGFGATNTADKYNFVHQSARFSITFLLRLSLVGLTHLLLENNLAQTANVGLSLSINTSARPVLLVTRGVIGQSVINLTGTTALSANVIYLLTVTSDGTTARLYLDGAQDASAAVGTTGGTNATAKLNIGRRDDGTNSMRGTFFLAGLWSRCLLPSEVRQLAGDPMRLLRRDRSLDLRQLGLPFDRTLPPDNVLTFIVYAADQLQAPVSATAEQSFDVSAAPEQFFEVEA
jgi:hypothetical protein